MSTVTLHVGDVHDRLREIPDDTVDLIVTSPPFLALRSYLPADHPDKHREIGSEATPAAFLDTLLALTAEWRRVLAPHGSLCVELGDTYSHSGGAGGDYAEGGWRAGQPGFGQPQIRKGRPPGGNAYGAGPSSMSAKIGTTQQWNAGGEPIANGGDGWPLAKSLTGSPTLYTWCLAYGRNLLTGHPSPAGQWRIRNLLVWARPNPPVGALGDKFRPACSYITVACTGPRRWFDLDGVRQPAVSADHHARYPQDVYVDTGKPHNEMRGDGGKITGGINTAGAPPLDWHDDQDDGPTGDRLWQMPTQPYKGAHYATYPLELPRRLIDAMCPREVCRVCGKPRERIVKAADGYAEFTGKSWPDNEDGRGKANGRERNSHSAQPVGAHITAAQYETVGWSDCGHDNYRPGLVLDPFLGSGTTAVAAAQLGRDCVGIDLDPRNTGLVDQRLAEKVHVVDTNYRADRTVTYEAMDAPMFRPGYISNDGSVPNPNMAPKVSQTHTATSSAQTTVTWHCDAPLPDQSGQIEGQTNLFDLVPDMVDVDTGDRL